MGGNRHRNNARKKSSTIETKNEISRLINEIDPLCSKSHRLIVTDKGTKMQFLLATDAQVSFFPKCLLLEKSDNHCVQHSDVYVDSIGTLIYTFGQILLKIDLGLGKNFHWKFILVDFKRPIIGMDFLSHFHLQINFQRMCLMNLETGLETTRISAVACECHRDVNFDDGWPNITAISKRPIKHRNHITDKNTKNTFLIGCTSQISVFPKLDVKEEEIEPFNDSFDLHGVYGKVAQVHGWTTKNLDFGLGREFTWKFAVIDIDKPIIGYDFIQNFGLTQQLKMGYFSLFDSQTKMETPAPCGPCDCGNFREGWPKSHFLITKHLKEDAQSEEKFLEHEQTSTSLSQDSETWNICKEFPRLLKLTSESTKGNVKSFNPKSKELDKYPAPFTQNPRTFDEIKEFVTCNENREPLIEFSKGSNQYPKPFKQNLKPFKQSLGESQVVKPIPKPFKQKPKLSDGNCERSKQSPELSTLRKKPEGEIPKSKEKLPKGKKTNSGIVNQKSTLPKNEKPKGNPKEQPPTKKVNPSKLDNESNRKENSRRTKEESKSNGNSKTPDQEKPKRETPKPREKLPKGNKANSGIVNQKSTLPKNEKPKGNLKEQPSTNKVNPSKLDNESNRKQNSRRTKEESKSNGNSKILDQEATEEKSLFLEIYQPRINHLSSSSQVDNFNVKHRFHVFDKNSRTLFLIGTESELSVFPQQEMRGKIMEPFDESFRVNGAFGKKEKVFGWTTRVIDIGVGREFTWKFAVVNICKPVLGWDFISHFGFTFHTGGLIDWETHITAPPPRGPCDCGKINDGWPAFVNFMKTANVKNSNEDFDSSSDLLTSAAKESQLEKKDSAGNDKRKRKTRKQKSECKDSLGEFEKSMNKKIKSRKTDRESSESKTKKTVEKEVPILPIKEDFNSVSTAKKTKSSSTKRGKETKACKDDSKPKLEGEEPTTSSNVSSVVHKSDIKHRFHFTDKMSKLTFFLDTKSEISVFPKSKLGEKHLEKFEAFYEIVDSEGSILPIYGWVTRKLDFGLKMKMFWRFAVIDTDRPVLTLDFPKECDLRINFKKQILFNKFGKNTGFPSEPCDCRKFETSVLPSFKMRPIKSKNSKHSFHLKDKNSQTLYFISKTAQVSLFPRSLIQNHSMEISAGSERIDCISLILPVYGWVTLKVDFGLEREFEWKFAVVDTIWPIIGIDFLKNFGLQVDNSMEYPRLLDPMTNLITPKFTGHVRIDKEFYFPVSAILRKSESTEEEFSVQKKLKNKTTRCSNDLCPQDERMIFIERETGMPYLLSGAKMSVFPKSEAKKEEIEPFDDNFDLVQLNGSVVPIHGWITRKLDFGLGRYFFWKFALITTERPMLANDFLHYYNFTVLYKGRSIFDDVTGKTVVSSTEFCECQARHFWPDISSMTKRPKSGLHRLSTPDNLKEDNLSEVDDYLNLEVFIPDTIETFDE